MGKNVLDFFEGYQLSREEIDFDRKIHDEMIECKGLAFFLLKDGVIIRVWWGQKPAPEDIRQVINKIEGAIVR